MAGIEAGAECERLGPRLSALADGEAVDEELAALRTHLRTCLSCRARLREFRAVPSRVAALVPPAALVTGPGGDSAALRSVLESVVGAAQHKAAIFAERAHGAVELATGGKVAAVAASAAAVAGGGAATVDRLGERDAGSAPAAEVRQAKAKVRTRAPARNPAPPAPVRPQAQPRPQPAPAPAHAVAPSSPPKPAPTPANEFAPEAAAPAAVPRPPTASPADEFMPARGGGSGEGEFGP